MPATELAPYIEAAQQIASKGLMPTKLGSKAISQLATDLKVRSVFSAKIESARVLEAIREGMENILNIATRPSGKISSRSDMMTAIREAAIREGVIPTGPGIQDITSVPRLKLIVDMNSKMATGYADWSSGQSNLDYYPAQRFERVEFREHPRDDWPERWIGAANDVNWQGVAQGNQMVALKTSPIWERLSVFGTPWEPFDWGSGMGLNDVAWDEAVSLGLVMEDEQLAPMQDNFNAGLTASVKGIDPAILARLNASFEGDAELDGDEIVYAGE